MIMRFALDYTNKLKWVFNRKVVVEEERTNHHDMMKIIEQTCSASLIYFVLSV
jgi:hypothetical protein